MQSFRRPRGIRIILFILFFHGIASITNAQSKPPLDHKAYDHWESIESQMISPNGEWVVYTIGKQEGDGMLVIASSYTGYNKIIPRGYGAVITRDSRFVVFKIKPLYLDIRNAGIQKKKEADFPKDSLGIVELGRDSVRKFPRVRSFMIPEKSAEFIAWLYEKSPVDSGSVKPRVDSAGLRIDTLPKQLRQPVEHKPDRKRKQKVMAEMKKDEMHFAAPTGFENQYPGTQNEKEGEGSSLVIYQPASGNSILFPNIVSYLWSANAKIMAAQMAAVEDSGKAGIIIWRSPENRVDTISLGGNDFRNIAIDETGYQLAFVAEKDSSRNDWQKYYSLWYWRNGQDSASLLVGKNTGGMKLGFTVSPDAPLRFSKSGKRLFFGTAVIQPTADTTVNEYDKVNLDIWHYNDPYLQPKQLKELGQEKKRSYVAVYDFNWQKMIQLADEDLPQLVLNETGDGDNFLGVSDVGKQIPEQWEGRTKKDLFSVNPVTGNRTLVKKDISGGFFLSPSGRFIIWYDEQAGHYFSWFDGQTRNISRKVPVKLFEEEFDLPGQPSPYGLMTWTEDEKSVFVYDRYDIWQLDPRGRETPVNLTEGDGRKRKITYRFIATDPETRFIRPHRDLLLSSFNRITKESGLSRIDVGSGKLIHPVPPGPWQLRRVNKARDTGWYIYSRESYVQSPDLYASNDLKQEYRLSHINSRQNYYNWGTAGLFTWRAYDGKEATGILYKPENFDPRKKYPLICYIYERLSDGLYNYIPPAPTPSRLNISFFVSRGYLVFAPDIRYSLGSPGNSAYNYVVSGVRAVVRQGYTDSTRIGLQGQSWGGYEVAYLITRTRLFKAAWAGAPVANMTSSYGEIRWTTGRNRQFLYEKSQSRIGATLWEKPQRYIENSPLFRLPNVNTPLVIMANDQDGVVPWYQGIELFTGLRRLGKKVWLLNYNGEAHNLVERKNRKDLQIREQQYFDWLLKGDRPPVWLTIGVPAILKGVDDGLEIR